MPTATLKMFLAYGDPKRLRTDELSNWTGKAVSGPRSEFDKVVEREESQGTGVYFLTGTDPETNKSGLDGVIGWGQVFLFALRLSLAAARTNLLTRE